MAEIRYQALGADDLTPEQRTTIKWLAAWAEQRKNRYIPTSRNRRRAPGNG